MDIHNFKKKLSDRMGFGKYRDKTVRWVIEHDVEYMAWALGQIDWLKLDAEANNYYQDKFDDFTFSSET